MSWKDNILNGCEPGHTVGVHGPNFSGRTDLLRYATGLDTEQGMEFSSKPVNGRTNAYIGPEVYNALSGLASTVRGELMLHGAFRDGTISDLSSRVGLTDLLDRNPFTLSGGEQTCLAIVCALGLEPDVLGCDCPTEQLDSGLKSFLFQWMNSTRSSSTLSLIVDNRISESRAHFARWVGLDGLQCDPAVSTKARFLPLDSAISLLPPLMPPCELHIDDVHFAYERGAEILSGITLRLVPGIYLLDGRNGSGKSTLAKILAGVLKPHAGRILRDGVPLRLWEHPGSCVAYHFQNPDLQLFTSTVRDELAVGVSHITKNASEVDNRVNVALGVFGLQDVAEQHPLDLPFVIRKRIAMAATLAMGRPWMILDEPTLGQDDAAVEQIVQIVCGQAAVGCGVIVISHADDFRRRLGASTLSLRDGMIKEVRL